MELIFKVFQLFYNIFGRLESYCLLPLIEIKINIITAICALIRASPARHKSESATFFVLWKDIVK
jgi:hypothetical protein